MPCPRFCIRAFERISFRGWVFALVLAALPACRMTNLPVWKPNPVTLPDAEEVQHIRDIAYYDHKQADTVRHRLDLFLPKGKKDFPVLVLVHGGAWVVGDNRCCGLYSSVGQFLASQGVGVVLPNYRLSPSVKHPQHIKDLAHAFAWIHAHIAEYGGRPDQIFLVGHSAGGHLATLLATDEQYLNAEQLQTGHIRGVIGISGVYRIPAGKTSVVLGGNLPTSLRYDALAPFRSDSTSFAVHVSSLQGLPLTVNIFGPAFGNDPLARWEASPVKHVRQGLPPFLLLTAEKDLPLLPGMADEFHQTLLEHGVASQRLCIEKRNHNSILFRAIEPNDPVARAILDFIGEPAKKR